MAVGIIGRPELLFLDEPTAGFDPQARRDFHDLVHRLTDLEDTTILLTTHDLDEAEKLADRILILSGGRIVADGSADELARRVTREAQVKWSRDGEQFVHATTDAAAFVRDLLAQHADVADLEVRRATLEDTYLAMVQQAGERPGPPRDARPTQAAATGQAPGREGELMNPTTNADPHRHPTGDGSSSSRACAARRTRASTSSCRVVVLAYLFFNRNNEVEGTDLLVPDGGHAQHPGGAGGVRDDHRAGLHHGHGARGRHPAAGQGGAQRRPGPRGRATWCAASLGIIPSFARHPRPGHAAFPGLMANGLEGWVTVAWVTVLGILATLPIGLVIGSLVPGVQKVGTWGMLPFAVLTGISGIFYPDHSRCGAGSRWWPRCSRSTGWGSGCARRSCPTRRRRSRSAGRGGPGGPSSCSALWAVAGLLVAPGGAAPDGAAPVRLCGRGGSGAGAAMGAVSGDTVYNRIAMLRVERGISRRDLAEALGVHYQTIGYLERGEYSPSLHLALSIARYFEVPLEVVFSTEPFARIGTRADTG